MKKEKVFVVIGGKWFDKVNGNTYHSAKVIDTQSREIFYSRFCYGYGSQYLVSAKELIESMGVKNYTMIDGGSFYMKKTEVKNGLF